MNGLGRKNNKKENKNQTVFTKETFGVVLILFATLALVCLITRDSVFSVPGRLINAFLFGCFGFFAYAVVLYAIICGAGMIIGKKSLLSKKRKTLITLTFSLCAFITHVITMHGKNLDFGAYLIESYMMAADGFATASGGGIVVALIAQPVSALLTEIGTYVVCGILLAVTVYFLVKDFMGDTTVKEKNTSEKFRSSFVKQKEEVGVKIEGEKEYPVENAVDVKPISAKQKLFVSNPNDFQFKSKRDLLNSDKSVNIKLGFAGGGLGVVSKPQEEQKIKSSDSYEQKLDYIKTPPNIDLNAMRTNVRPNVTASNSGYYVPKQSSTTVSNYVNQRTVSQEQPKTEEIPFIEHSDGVTVKGDTAGARAETFGKYAALNEVECSDTSAPMEDDVVVRAVKEGRIEEIVDDKKPVVDIPFIEEDFGQSADDKQPKVELSDTNLRTGRARDILFEENKEEVSLESAEQENTATELPKERNRDSLGFTSRVNADGNLSSRRNLAFGEEKVEHEQPKPEKVQPPINREYFRPPFDLLENYAPPVDMPKENHQERMEIIQRTLEEFHINAVPQSYVQGPSITRYEIMMPAGVSVKKVLGFDDDLKMRLAAKDGVRIEAPIPGKNLVGIEVANSVKTTVGLREILEGSAGQKAKDGALMFALGKDLVGKPIMDDLSKGPHYLVAGATGSGKSVCLNLMIVSLIMRYSPEDLRLILVDPKGVEFINYEHIPHLMIDEIITEPKKALAVLSWAYAEMERRFSVFRENGGGLVVDIDSYNSVVASDTVAKMPRIVIIIDELADLMETCKKDLESRIRAIAQKARAAGIHLVLATQRPSVDIITGTIKANLPSRIAFKVMNFNDSQTILSEAGAEKLLGNGDMLYKTARMSSTERYQGAYISSREVNNVVSYIKEHNAAYFDDELKEYLEKETKPKQEEASATDGGEGGDDLNEVNEFFLKALWLAVNTETVSISQLQRRFQIGYSRAGGLVDKMERMGFVSGNEGSKARRVLLTREQFEERFGSMPD